MSNVGDCNVIMENLDGTEYLGRTMKVNFADKPKLNKEPLYQETEYTLFVGNLSWTVTSNSLASAFRECGEVVGARVMYDGDNREITRLWLCVLLFQNGNGNRA